MLRVEHEVTFLMVLILFVLKRTQDRNQNDELKKLTLGLLEGPCSLHYRTHVHQREDLGRIEKSLAGDLGLLIITRWLALLKASYFPAGKETLPPRRY